MILDCFLDIKVEDNIFFRVYLFASYKKIIILLSLGGGPDIDYVPQRHFSQQFLPESQGVECLDMGTSRFV